MQFLVTGAAGFLGSALANHLTQLGHAVRGLDDLSAGDPARLLPNVPLTRGDVNDRPKLWSLLQGVDCVYHLAAKVSVPESVLYPREYNAVNVGGTVSLMEAMRDAGVKRVVFASSGAVYGEQKTQPLREDLLTNPRSPYAASKLAAEAYVRTIGALVGIETLSLRIFNVYGPGQPLPATHPPVIPRFLHQALHGGSLVVFGDGAHSRDYVYVDDVVRALVTAATAPTVEGGVVNVGSGVATTGRELVAAIARATGKQVEVIYSKAETGAVRRMQADLKLARKALDFRPKVSLDDGLALMLKRDARFAGAR